MPRWLRTSFCAREKLLRLSPSHVRPGAAVRPGDLRVQLDRAAWPARGRVRGRSFDSLRTRFAAAVGAPYALALSSGTAALHLALSSGTAALHLALILAGDGPGDEVLVSTLTFSASANPIAYLGARPTFIDSERTSWNLDPGLLAETLAAWAQAGKLPKAVIPVHLYGQSADLEPILAACARHDVPVIEDAAEALGATYWGAARAQADLVPAKSGESGQSASHSVGRSPGAFGWAGIFSFNGKEIITTSGSGMLVLAHLHHGGSAGIRDQASGIRGQGRGAAG